MIDDENSEEYKRLMWIIDKEKISEIDFMEKL